MSRFGPWRVRLEDHHGRCEGTVVLPLGGGQSEQRQCLRSGGYGWYGQGYCYQHHPDYPAWEREHARLTRIAQAAVDRTMRAADPEDAVAEARRG